RGPEAGSVGESSPTGTADNDGQLDASMKELNQAVAEQAEQNPSAVLLMTHPGVGPVSSLAFVLTLGPVERFERSKQVVSYLGLNPREHSSGGRNAWV